MHQQVPLAYTVVLSLTAFVEFINEYVLALVSLLRDYVYNTDLSTCYE